ncbi:hypothetical protein MRX96_020169 [Rhipicephalus microplus]
MAVTVSEPTIYETRARLSVHLSSRPLSLSAAGRVKPAATECSTARQEQPAFQPKLGRLVTWWSRAKVSAVTARGRHIPHARSTGSAQTTDALYQDSRLKN